jgi:hypothetical protein
MNRANTHFQRGNRVVELALVGFILAALSCRLYVMGQGCEIVHAVGWVAFELARPVLSAAIQSAPAHLCSCSCFAQQLLQIVASNWAVLCVLAG